MTAIDDKWSANQWLGAPVDEGAGGNEGPLPDGRGRSRDFQNGSIMWTPEHGAFEVHGDIREKWAQLGGSCGVLRYPVSDESGCRPGRGRYNHFEGGTVVWRADIGAHAVFGTIRDKWASQGWQDSPLGYPTSDEIRRPGVSRTQRFENGSITWTPQRGAVIGANVEDG